MELIAAVPLGLAGTLATIKFGWDIASSLFGRQSHDMAEVGGIMREVATAIRDDRQETQGLREDFTEFRVSAATQLTAVLAHQVEAQNTHRRLEDATGELAKAVAQVTTNVALVLQQVVSLKTH